VLTPGEVVRFGGPVRKDVAGYDLRALLCGSEGTLGIVTAAWLRLIPAPEAAHVVVAVLEDPEAGQAALERVLASGVVPAAIEYLDAATLRAAPPPWDGEPGFALVVEVDGSAHAAAAARDEVLAALREDGAARVHVPGGGRDVRELWRWRGGVSYGVTAQRGAKLSEDIAVPVEHLAEAVRATLAIGARHALDACSWGHAGDGNLHATFLLVPGDAAMAERAEAAARELFALAVRLGGTVSGEHGVGVLKNGQLTKQWAPGAVAAHRAVKAALDPKGLLNPGKKLA
jgi:FAD/FMN-containing dehydrogenase